MKIGLCLEMVFDGEPLEQRLEKAAQIGFKYVEMWFVDGTYKGTPEALKQCADNAGVTITNSVVGAPDGSLGGGLTDPRRRDEWLKRAELTFDFNQRAGINASIVCTGNMVNGLTYQQTYDSILQGLEKTVALAEKADITLLLEPLNTPYDHPGYWLAGSHQAGQICRKLQSPKMKLLFDCYHMQIMEGDLVNHIKANIDVIGHFHAAGVPGRHEPFNGEINYPFIVQQIEAMKYDGVFALECTPSTKDHRASLEKMLAHLQPQH